jgi:DNA repair protein RecO (recombination protein O)
MTLSSSAIATDAVLLKSVAYGEADLIVTLFTRARGKLSALARGARGSKRRFAGALGTLVVSRVELRPRPASELWVLASATPTEAFHQVAADVVALAHAGWATELVRELSAPEQPDQEVFDLLLGLYRLLGARGPSVTALRAFELALLDHAGLAPVLDRCVGCGSLEPAALNAPGAVFDPGRGGVACSACAGHATGHGVRPLPAPARALLLAAQRATSPAEVHDGGAPPAGAREARDALLEVLLAHVGKPLRSLEFLKQLAGTRSTEP